MKIYFSICFHNAITLENYLAENYFQNRKFMY